MKVLFGFMYLEKTSYIHISKSALKIKLQDHDLQQIYRKQKFLYVRNTII